MRSRRGAAEATEARYRSRGSIRVATKYPNITRAFYASRGDEVEIVKLHGNIELAPLTGLAERIVDITATGTTLRENNLVVVDEVFSSTRALLRERMRVSHRRAHRGARRRSSENRGRRARRRYGQGVTSMRRIVLSPGEEFTPAHLSRTSAFNAAALEAATAIIADVCERGR